MSKKPTSAGMGVVRRRRRSVRPSDDRAALMSRGWVEGGLPGFTKAGNLGHLKLKSRLDRVCKLRSLYGEELFPFAKRGAFRMAHLSQAEVAALGRAWRRGGLTAFAKVAGLEGAKRTHQSYALSRARKRFGTDLFPYASSLREEAES